MAKSYEIINKIFKDAGVEFYLVGGCVRDYLLNIPPHDIDFTTNAKPEKIKEILKNANIKYTNVGEKFGTIVALLDGEEFEITTYRKESEYRDSRHPSQISFSDFIQDDLIRRDFTINAMAFDLDSKTLIDPFLGSLALQNKILTCVGNPNDRFKEDALRILRAIRFAIKYDLAIDEATKQAMLNNKEGLQFISKERITEELRKILTLNRPIFPIFNEFHEIIFEIIPELKPCYQFDQHNIWHKHDVYEHILHVVDGCNTDKFTIKLAALLHDIGKPEKYTMDENGHGHFHGHPERSYEITQTIFQKDLRLTQKEKIDVLNLVRYHDSIFECTNKSAKSYLQKFGIDFIRDFCILKQADRDDHIYADEKIVCKMPSIPKFLNLCEEIEKHNECFSLKNLAINGKDLMELGYEKGPIIGETLNMLLEMVISDVVLNEKDSLLKVANEFYENTILEENER